MPSRRSTTVGSRGSQPTDKSRYGERRTHNIHKRGAARYKRRLATHSKRLDTNLSASSTNLRDFSFDDFSRDARSETKMDPAIRIPSPLPEEVQGRGSPIPMNLMQGGNIVPSMTANQAAFFKNMNGIDPNIVNAAHMAGGMRPPPSSHPNQPFNGQITPQMMAARQAQRNQAGPNQMQWPGGPNGVMIQGPQVPVRGTPQQRAAQMPPPFSFGAGGNPANGRTQPSSPATSNAAPPTPQQSTKALVSAATPVVVPITISRDNSAGQDYKRSQCMAILGSKQNKGRTLGQSSN